MQEGLPLYTSRAREFAHYEDRRTSTLVSRQDVPSAVPMKATMDDVGVEEMVIILLGI